MEPVRRISPAEIVAKLREMEYSIDDKSMKGATLIETLWFIQAASHLPQGLNKLAEKMVSSFPQNLGPECIRDHWSRPELTRAQGVQFWDSVPERCKEDFNCLLPEHWRMDAWEILADETEEQWKAMLQKESGFPVLELAKIRPILKRIAVDDLAHAMFQFCTRPVKDESFSVWSFKDAYQCLQQLMRDHAGEKRQNAAETTVTNRVFHALDFAWEKKHLVQLRGDPRFGKTEAVKTWCEMYPGRARLITVSEGTTDREFFESVALGMGIEIGHSQTVASIKRSIEEVLQHARLMLVMDEGHYLLPHRYSSETPPARMNWLRAKLPDRNLACALIITPQSFDTQLQKFAKKTHYRFEQFFGRTATFELPNALSAKDLLAVAAFHFPQMEIGHLARISAAAAATQGCLNTIKQTADYANFLASQAGRAVASEDDVLAAIEWAAPKLKTHAPGRRLSKGCNAVAEPLHRGVQEPTPGENEEISRVGRNDSLRHENAGVIAA